MKKRVYSAMRPTGELHIGHYFGAIKNWVKMQEEYDCFFAVADWHALTTNYDNPENIKEMRHQMVISWIAAGLDVEKAPVFIQSHNLYTAELYLLLGMVTPVPWLERCPSYKDMINNLTHKDLSNYGFLGYPVLMTSDIIMYLANFVLEIGPGIGTMTQYLCEHAREVVAVEIDKKLIPILEQDTLSAYKNVTIINEDILKVDINAIVQEKNNGKPIKVVANLPYYITTPIIMGLFESHVPLESITIMVQKEVAERMQVGPGTKDYGALSLAVQYYAKPEVMLTVPAGCFMPRPNVDSSVIKLTRHEKPCVSVSDEKWMFDIIRASFNQRRKTLVNGLGNAPELNLTKENILSALEKTGLSPTVRGEALTLEQFASLADVLR